MKTDFACGKNSVCLRQNDICLRQNSKEGGLEYALHTQGVSELRAALDPCEGGVYYYRLISEDKL